MTRTEAAEVCRRVADEMEGCEMDGSALVAGADAIEENERLKEALLTASELLRKPKHPTNRAESALAVLDACNCVMERAERAEKRAFEAERTARCATSGEETCWAMVASLQERLRRLEGDYETVREQNERLRQELTSIERETLERAMVAIGKAHLKPLARTIAINAVNDLVPAETKVTP